MGIKVQKASFAYNRQSNLVLDEINLKILDDRITGIIGNNLSSLFAVPAYYQSGQGYMAQHSQNVLQSFWGLHRCVSSTFTSFSLKYLPLPLTHMSACPQLGVEPQLGCLCPSCSSLGCISAPTNCKVIEVSQHCKNSLIIHIRKSVRAAKPSRIQVHYTLS